MATILSFLTGGIGRWIVLFVISAIAATFIRHTFINEGRQQVLAENQKAAVKIITKQGEVTTKVVTQYVKVKGDTQKSIEYVDREVIKYAEANTGLCLDADWRRLHDAAAINRIPKSGQQLDGESATSAAITIRLRSAHSLASLADGYGELR